MVMNTMTRLPTPLSSLVAMVTHAAWLPLFMLLSLLPSATAVTCDWREFWDDVVKKYTDCKEICDPARDTMAQCYRECADYARVFLTCQLSSATSSVTSAFPQTSTSMPDQHLSTGFVSAMICIVIGTSTIFAIGAFCLGKWWEKRNHKKCAAHCPYTSQPEREMMIVQPNTEGSSQLCMSPVNNASDPSISARLYTALDPSHSPSYPSTVRCDRSYASLTQLDPRNPCYNSSAQTSSENSAQTRDTTQTSVKSEV